MYGPLIDLAVGPFATERQYIAEYDRMAKQSAALIGYMLRLSSA
jgi:hypothetical protein